MGGTGGWPVHLHFGVYYDQNSDGYWTQDEVVDPYGWNIFGWAGSAPDPWRISSKYLWKYPLDQPSPISSAGGSITSTSGNIVVMVPAGALTSTVTFDLWDTPPVAEPSAQLRTTGHSFLLNLLQTPTGNNIQSHQYAQFATAVFAQPVTVSVTYAATDVLHLDPNQLMLFRWDAGNNTWTPLSTTVDITQNQAVVQTTEVGKFDLQAPLLCPADSHEPDDDYYTAAPAATDGTLVSRLFDTVQDQDWLQLTTIAGAKYTIQTSNLAQGVEAIVQVHDQDGVTQLASADNGIGQATQLIWQAPSSGTYFIRLVSAPGGTFGCSATYELTVHQQLFVYLPLILRNH